MGAPVSLHAMLVAGAAVGVAGVALFGLIHAAVIVPIWDRLARGIPFGIVAGVAMGWALYELQRPFGLRPRAARIVSLTFGGLLWLTLIPMTLFGMGLRAAGMHGADNNWEVVVEALLSVVTGAAAGWAIGSRISAALAVALASLALTLAQAGPIPITTSLKGARLFAGLSVVYVLSGAALGMLGSIMSGRAARLTGSFALLRFFLFTFALTWAAWLVPRALGAPASGGLFGLGGPVFLVGVFAPGLVALAMTASREGAAGVRRLLARIGRWDVAARFYFLAVSYLAAVKLTSALIHRIATGSWPPFGSTPWPLIVGAILVSTWVQAGEEVGWRGYALPRLSARLGLGPASILLGMIWALWHLPLFFLPGAGSTGQSFPIYLLHVTALSSAMAWLYWRTDGSLLLVMLMHASVDNTTGIVPTALPGASNPWTFSGSLMAWSTVAVSWLTASVFLYQMRGANISAMTGSPAVPSQDMSVSGSRR